MNIDLTGKTALITGSTAGIGFAIAQSLAQSGARVYLNGRTQDSVEAATKRLRSKVPNADISGVAADVGTSQGATQIFESIVDADILVNNAGIFEPKPFFEITDSDWQKFFDVNVMSGVRMSRHFTPKMIIKKWGRVIFISSESAINIPKEMVHYGMTKTAMLSVSRGLAETVAGTGVTVNAVMPGPTKTEGVVEFVKKIASSPNQTFEEQEKEFFKLARPSSLIKRFATVEEVASLVTYVASKEASATTGAALRVDGGVIQSIL
jgi:NAD(P)-dependent dehydrogenase (short-subunit alcohol dehydrogenase family)